MNTTMIEYEVSRRGVLPLTALALAAIACLAVFPSPASARQTHLFLETFGSANQPSFDEALSPVVVQSSGEVVVLDAGASTITRWNPDGTPSDFAALGTNVIDGVGSDNCPTTPADCDQTPQNGLAFAPDFAGIYSQIAVDNSGTVTDGNIYVTQNLGGGGTVQAIDVFAQSGEYLDQITGAGGSSFHQVNGLGVSPCGVAVDPAGNLYVGGWFEDQIYKYDPAANPPQNADHVASFPFDEPCGVAAGAGPSAGALFVDSYGDHAESGPLVKLNATTGTVQYPVKPSAASTPSVDPATGHVYTIHNDTEGQEYDASGADSATLISTFLIPTFPGGEGVAVHGASGKVYAAGSDTKLRTYGPVVTVPDVTTGSATITGLDSATLNGTVNPDGEPLTNCHFEYLTDAAYQANPANNKYAGATPAPCAETPGEIGSGSASVAVSAAILGLATPGVTYRYRLVAANANAAAYPDDPNGTPRGTTASFSTPDEPALGDTWTQDVGVSEATLKAEVNPKNAPTTYRFEWGPDDSYGNVTAELAVGSDETEHTVGFLLEGLDPETTYHYRVVATNPLGAAEGPDRTFTTFPEPEPNTGCPNQAFRTGPSAALPDCRAFEMVSPLDKNNGDIASASSATVGVPASYYQSAADGNGLTYSSVRSFGAAKSAPYTSQYLARRDPAQGWATEPISPPQDTTQTPSGVDTQNVDAPFFAFSGDLSSGWLRQLTDPPLAPGAQPGYMNIYRRDNAAGTYEALTNVAPPNRVPYTAASTGGTSPEEGGYHARLQGLSADGSHAVFVANDRLTADASSALNAGSSYPDPIDQLYEYRQGKPLRLVSVLPGAAANPTSSAAGGAGLFNIRADNTSHTVSADGSRIFWTAHSRPPGAGGGPGRIYARIDPDPNFEGDEQTVAVSESVSADPALYWTASAQGDRVIFTTGGSNAIDNLYSFDVDAEKETLTAGDVRGFVGASEDARRVYFLSTQALAGGASAAQLNLYLHEEGEPIEFIATLANGEGTTNNSFSTPPDPGIAAGSPGNRASRVSPDGRYLAFISRAPLTGYDNTDATGGVPAVEVYRYDAEADGGAGELLCPSCNPSGARPMGRPVGEPPRYTAAQIPGYRSPFHAQRVLAEDGSRLYFEAYDALLPTDTNGEADVYQWEAPGSGDCTTARPEYFEANGGCIALISSGTAVGDAGFVDASVDGSDVFFTTGESLLAQDYGLVDVYDARVNGGFPALPPIPAPCEGESCRGASPAAPPAAGAGSAAFAGPGDPQPRPDCSRLARLAKRFANGARRLARAARRASQPRRSKTLRKRSRRLAGKAERLSRSARRCRGRARANRRAER